jgi:ATP-binding cassette, subfamily B, bacterial
MHLHGFGRETPKGPRAPLRRVAGLFLPYKTQLLFVAAAILLTSGLGVANPLMVKVVFDRALFPHSGHTDLHLLVLIVGVMAALPVALSLIGLGQTYLMNRVGQEVMLRLRDDLYQHLQEMSLRFFTDTRTGEIQSRLTNDVGGVQSVLTDTASSILSNIVIVISSLIAMLVISWQLTALSLCLLPVFLILTHRVGRIRRAIAATTQEARAEMSAITEETLSVSGVLLTKVFHRQRAEIGRFSAENQRLAQLSIKQTMIGRGFFGGVGTFFSLLPVGVYLVAGLQRAAGVSALSAGTIVAFTALQSRIFFPIGQLLQVSVEVQASMALFHRVFEYLDLPVDILDAPDALALPVESVRGGVQLRNVWFRYDRPSEAEVAAEPGEPAGGSQLLLSAAQEGGRQGAGAPKPRVPTRDWALEDVSMEIAPGELAAIVGPSGAGKTTITYLVPRLYDVTRGSIAIDGIDVRDLQTGTLADAIGMVTQESYLFHATVRKNLLYAKPDATQEEIEAAARAAFIHDRIVELKDGYDTLVGERGYRLSGGEKQRLAIARVILKDPRILILDEATSALDTGSERLVQRALEPLMEGRTTIAIAHRLSTILAADVIFVLDRGRLVERGTHAELLRLGGLYAKLYEEQFKDGLVEAQCEDGFVLADGQVLSKAG